MSAGAIAGAVVMVLAIILAIRLGSAIARPIGEVVSIAQIIAGGNLAEARRRVAGKLERIENSGAGGQPAGKQTLNNETEKLIEAVVLMTKYLASLVGQVQRSSVQMVSTAAEIAARIPVFQFPVKAQVGILAGIARQRAGRLQVL